MNLRSHMTHLLQVLQTVQNLLGLESAVFDDSATLIACSSNYIKEKGTVVHKPSVQEVLESSEITVVDPGNMPSCQGCRFNGRCPATLELLKRILVDGRSVGVLAFSAFSQDDHDRLFGNMEYYKRSLSDFADLIATILKGAEGIQTSAGVNPFLDAMTALMPDGFLVTDRAGNIIDINRPALEMLEGACLKNIGDFLSAELVEEILSGVHVRGESISVDQENFFLLSASPIRKADGTNGAIVRLTRKSGQSVPSSVLAPMLRICGSSEHMKTVKRRMEKIVNSPSTVFLSGEAGTGKGALAAAIHNGGERRDKPFVTLNCANIPPEQIESELFGAEPLPGSPQRFAKRGKLEMADGGTLFIDEISEMPVSAQMRLLDLLEDRQFERVGGTGSVEVDVRIIAASNADMKELIAQKRFRGDLYYRLGVINIDMLPLRERMEDLGELLEEFLSKYNARLHSDVKGFAPEVMRLFADHRWPGNIRELENVVEYCVNMADGALVTEDDLPAYFLDELHARHEHSPSPLKDAETAAIRELLDRYGWDVKGKEKTAAELGVSLRTLYRKMKQSGLLK